MNINFEYMFRKFCSHFFIAIHNAQILLILKHQINEKVICNLDERGRSDCICVM